MRFLRYGYLSLFTLIFGCVTTFPPNVEAQLLPKLFNRGKGEPGREPINRNSPDITFIRDFGIPTPYASKIETVKGHQVAFYIYAKTKTPGMRVEFLVREFPSAGKIVSIVSNPENRSSAIVTYIADPNSGATLDAFTFAARYPGGKYSSAVRCAIAIKDAQALIEIAPEANFGKLMIGERAEKEITITNRGNAPWTTTLNLPPPWKMISPKDGRIQLPPGGQIWSKIEYKPMLGGTSNYNLILNRGDNGTCKLRGEATVPFEIVGDEFELNMNPETNRREGYVLVKSNNERPFEVFLRSSPRLKTKASEYTVLIPNKENHIGVYLDENDVMAFDGGLEIKMKNGFKEVTSIFANTVPGKLSIDIPGQLGNDVINFGKVTAGRSAERGILLKNKGGELMPLDVSVSEPFRILTDTDRQLVPLESIPVSIGFYPHKSDRGSADQFLTMRTNREEVKIRLVGNALRPPGAPRQEIPLPVVKKEDPPKPADSPAIGNNTTPPSPVPSPDRIKSSRMDYDDELFSPKGQLPDTDISYSPLGIRTIGITPRDKVSHLKPAEDFELVKSTSKSLEFSWTAPKNEDIEKFDLEIRGQRTNPITSMVESIWVPYPNVEYKRVDRLVRAKVKGLEPYTVYEFRVFTVGQNEKCSVSSLPFGSSTMRTMDWTYIYAGLAVIGLAFLGWAIVKIIKDRRGEVYQSQYV